MVGTSFVAPTKKKLCHLAAQVIFSCIVDMHDIAIPLRGVHSSRKIPKPREPSSHPPSACEPREVLLVKLYYEQNTSCSPRVVDACTYLPTLCAELPDQCVIDAHPPILSLYPRLRSRRRSIS